MHKLSLPWQDPVATARAIYHSGGDMAFLFSGMKTGFTGKYSYIAYGVDTTLTAEHFSDLEPLLSQNQSTFDNAWFGYLGYGLKHDTEELPLDQASYINLPNIGMTKFKHILVFDHTSQTSTLYSQDKNPVLPSPITLPLPSQLLVKNITSNMTKASYLAHVQTTLDAIHRGDLYQANITRKFYGDVAPEGLNYFEVFDQLIQISPSPYSIFIKSNDTYILSSSPEQFIHITPDGTTESRPIKGSAARFSDPVLDQQSLHELQHSAKDKMENLMIVDLMRNDLARGSVPGSVKVDRLFEVTPYKTIYHMSSTIHTIKHPGTSPLTMVKNCFPPGSMTGAPKIKAMQLCSQLENQARGVYSGAIGWFAGDGTVDLSVVIRTLIFQGKKFEFQTGGAIVADSTPLGEWQETILKVKALAQVLNLQADKDLLF